LLDFLSPDGEAQECVRQIRCGLSGTLDAIVDLDGEGE
jgi:hypothetical protein